MPFIEQPRRVGAKKRRILLMGPPNSGKTTSLGTFHGPLTAMSILGEKGFDSMPLKTFDGQPVKSLLYSPPEGEITNWAPVLNESLTMCLDEVYGKNGPLPKTFSLEGLHKLHALCLNVATFGASGRGDEFKALLYAQAHTKFFNFLDRISRSEVETIVYTVWVAPEKDDPDDRSAAPSRHIYPNLPGQAALNITGEVQICLSAARDITGQYMWQTQPADKVWGAGIKGNASLIKKLPLKVPQDWAKFEKLLQDAERA